MESTGEYRAFNQTKSFVSTYKTHILLLICGYLVLSVLFRIYGVDFTPDNKTNIDKVVIIESD